MGLWEEEAGAGNQACQEGKVWVRGAEGERMDGQLPLSLLGPGSGEKGAGSLLFIKSWASRVPYAHG